MTSSAGASGLMLAGSPPRSRTASRIVARSTTQGTPVKSCMITRAGVNWISLLGCAFGSQPASARMCSAVTFAPSSVRSRFSRRTLRLYGSRAEPSTASSRWMSYDLSPTCSLSRLPKLFADTDSSSVATARPVRDVIARRIVSIFLCRPRPAPREVAGRAEAGARLLDPALVGPPTGNQVDLTSPGFSLDIKIPQIYLDIKLLDLRDVRAGGVRARRPRFRGGSGRPED